MSKSDQVSGKAKEHLGKATGNREMEAEGKTQDAKGKAKESMEDLDDKARGAARGLTGKDKR